MSFQYFDKEKAIEYETKESGTIEIQHLHIQINISIIPISSTVDLH